MAQRLSELVARYKRESDKLSQRELAELERDIYEAYCFENPRRPSDGPFSRTHRNTLVELLGITSGYADNRLYLLRCGRAAEPLWKLVDEGKYTLSAVVMLLRNARKEAQSKGVSLPDVLERMLAEPKKRKFNRSNGSAKPLNAQDAKDFEEEAAELIRAYVARRAVDLDELERDMLLTNFLGMLRIAHEEFRESLQREQRSLRQQRRERETIGKALFLRACEVLSLDLPYGKELSDKKRDSILKLVRRRKAERVRELHPDLNPGQTTTSEVIQELNAAKEAGDLLVKYFSQGAR